MAMEKTQQHQLIISGVGGQGVLFVTRLMAEAAIRKGMPVFTSETHGMAQRGGTVISHLKVGEFSSPLIRPGQADGLIALKAECLAQHGGFLKDGAWAAVNSSTPPEEIFSGKACHMDADRLAQKIGNPRSLNLMMLGFTFSLFSKAVFNGLPFYCELEVIVDILKERLRGKDALLQASIDALHAGAGTGPDLP